MVRYQVTLAYDGTDFEGFQRQARARTVQGEVEKALRTLGWAGRAILSAGRTDTGVHASGQVIAFDLEWNHPLTDLLSAMNANLPADVAARSISPVSDDFHPRYSALARRYRYRIFHQEFRDPLRERYAWRIWPVVDADAMRIASQQLLGTHDFAAFGTPPRPESSTVRSVSSAAWRQQGDELIFEITGNAFLYHMVRRLVYTQVAVSQGRLSQQDFLLGLSQQRTLIPGLAPAQGLVLETVFYPPSGSKDNLSIYAEGSINSLAASGEDDRGQDFRP